MKEANWQECLDKNTARRITPDPQRAKSLNETAKQRIKVIRDVSNENSNFVFEDYYTSLLELLQARAFKQGYNILNHVCIGHFLKEILTRADLYETFEDLRYKRNGLTYYGNRMEHLVALQAIAQCKKLIAELDKH